MSTTFASLEALRLEIAATQEFHARSLREYWTDAPGFRHKYKEPKFSRTSTATCVLSLTATHRWSAEGEEEIAERPWHDKRHALIKNMLHVKGWTSAGLPEENPFTVAFLLEAVLALKHSDKKEAAP